MHNCWSSRRKTNSVQIGDSRGQGHQDQYSLAERDTDDRGHFKYSTRRISQALDVTPEGLSRVQIRALFHRHVSKERIDQALRQLHTLGLIDRETAPAETVCDPLGQSPEPENRPIWRIGRLWRTFHPYRA